MKLLRRLISYHGQLGMLFGEVAGALFRGHVRWRLVMSQIVAIGFGSQLVVMITGAFTGAVFAAQSFFKFSEIGMASATGPVVSIAMCRELGPVLAGLMVAGRMGASMAAEIGTMKVTEQIDALRSMGVSPVDYLVVPRMLAILISMPILVAESIALGILASDVLTTKIFGVPEVWYRYQLMSHTGPGDVMSGVIKGAFFGVLIALISCRHGLRTQDGAVGVGVSTTRAVVDSSLAILISNLILTLLLNEFFPMVSLN
ncbi:MAG: ABC transporter permease [Verrucomicrobiales bacterium]|nr:ABC transporter permease [Verrucomicrobiales bacterium]